MFFKLNKNNVNESEVDEVFLSAHSSGDFYRQVVTPNVNNIVKRMKRGDFQKNHLLTKKTFIDGLAKRANDNYEREFGDSGFKQFNVDTKRAIGLEVADDIFNKARGELHHHKITTTGKGQAMMARDNIKRVEENERIRKGMRF